MTKFKKIDISWMKNNTKIYYTPRVPPIHDRDWYEGTIDGEPFKMGYGMAVRIKDMCKRWVDIEGRTVVSCASVAAVRPR